MSETPDGQRVPDATDDSTPPVDDRARLTVWLSGHVQGVGMRWWVRARALELGLVGSAANRPDGRVEVVAEGERAAVDRLLGLLAVDAGGAGRPGRVDAAHHRWSPARGGISGFVER